MNELVKKNSNVFTKLNKCGAWYIKQKIEFLDPEKTVPYHRQQKISERELQEWKKHMQEYILKGWIQLIISQYGHPILFTCNKTRELRVCMYYISFNSNAIISRYPILCIDDTLYRLGYAKIFGKIDLASSYHQLEMHPDHYHRIAFQTKFSLLEYVVMPLGLSNALTIFQDLWTVSLRKSLIFFYFLLR